MLVIRLEIGEVIPIAPAFASPRLSKVVAIQAKNELISWFEYLVIILPMNIGRKFLKTLPALPRSTFKVIYVLDISVNTSYSPISPPASK